MARKNHGRLLPFSVPPQVEKNYIFEIWELFIRTAHITTRKLGPLRIASRHYAALAILAPPDKPATQSMLAKQMGLSPNIVLAMVDYLDRLGYTRRVQNARNRRENVVILTTKGRKTYDLAVRLLQEAEEELMATLSAQERDQFRTLTRKLCPPAPPAGNLPREFDA